MNIEVKYSSHYPLRHIATKQRYGLSCLRRPLNERAQRYDYGARQYDPTAPRFTTPDPLAEKYYAWNMYGYCMNNPVKFINPDGKKIRFADGVSDTFKANFAAAIRYLKENKCDGLIAKLEKRNEIIYIAERSDGSSSGYNPDNYTIYWDPYGGVSTTNGQTISPTTVLNHEADHAYEHITNNTEYNKNKNTEDSNYGNKEEKRVITGTEQRTAFALGEIRANEKTRTNHSGLYYPTISPTSTELDINKKAPTSIDEIVITPQNN